MEGGGVWRELQSLVIKAGCDYGDEHKNDAMQKYSAATAASCFKALIEDWDQPDSKYTPDCEKNEM